MTAAFADAIDNFVVRQYRAERLAPVDFSITTIGETIVHQDVLSATLIEGGPFRGGETQRPVARTTVGCIALLSEDGCEFRYAAGFAGLTVEPAVEKLQKDPLRPAIVGSVAGAHLARPVVAESNAVELCPEVPDVILRGYGRGNAMFDGILLGRQSEGVIAHRMQHIEALQALVAAVDITGYVSQGMADMQARTAGIGEHVEHVALGTPRVVGHAIRTLILPSFLPFSLNIPELVFHK